VIDSDYKVSDEMFWTGYEPPGKSALGSKASFYRHLPRDTDFDFIVKRAIKKQKSGGEQMSKPCDVV
jgi:hypothetical protein